LADADLTLNLPGEAEITALTLMRASVVGHQLPASPLAAQSAEIAGRLARARYAVVVHDAEPTAEQRNPLRAEALIALTQALNGPTRAALCSLRAGGNRVGAESALTSQTGYPFAVDYSRGYPRYRPDHRGLAGLESGAFRAALIVGSPPMDESTRNAFSRMTPAIIGPRASQAPFTTTVAVDTGVAGIHEEGSAYRMDEVPLGLRASVSGPRSTTAVLLGLTHAIRAELARVE
jgi:formylmethanofuran dehydrogenase subunit B